MFKSTQVGAYTMFKAAQPKPMLLLQTFFKTDANHEEIKAIITKHREFLNWCFSENKVVFAGANEHKSGGIWVSQLESKDEFYSLLRENDPLWPFIDESKTTITGFNLGVCHPNFASFISGQRGQVENNEQSASALKK
jgi:uncharacterized protein YciI